MPDIELPRKLERILYTTARIIVLIGGRDSAKSESAGRFVIMKCQLKKPGDLLELNAVNVGLKGMLEPKEVNIKNNFDIYIS